MRICRELLHTMGAPRITTTIKLGTRTDRNQTMEDKIRSVEDKLRNQQNGIVHNKTSH